MSDFEACFLRRPKEEWIRWHLHSAMSQVVKHCWRERKGERVSKDSYNSNSLKP